MISIAELVTHKSKAPLAILDWEWSEESTFKIKEILHKIFGWGYEPPSYYNSWIFLTDNNGWVVGRRVTWNGFYIGGTWEKLEQDLIKENLPYNQRHKEEAREGK